MDGLTRLPTPDDGPILGGMTDTWGEEVGRLVAPTRTNLDASRGEQGHESPDFQRRLRAAFPLPTDPPTPSEIP